MLPSPPPTSGFNDPRGRGFRSRVGVDKILEWIDEHVSALPTAFVPLSKAAGRVLAVQVVAADPVPQFARAAMDGFAVIGEETFGAELYTPAVFKVVGRSRPGTGFAWAIERGQAVAIATGAPLPAGSDTVVPVELTRTEGDRVLVTEAVAPGRHVGSIGEDIAAGATVFQPGRVLRPQDLGVLSALGISQVEVVRSPRVSLIVTGDELLTAGSTADGCRIADMNSVMVAALVERDGGSIAVTGPIRDDRQTLVEAIQSALPQSDCLMISGGSSTGPEDHAPGVVAELGQLVIHGVALRPASPTGLGLIADRPVFLLPGNPVSCLCAYDLFAGRAVRRLGGRSADWPYRADRLPLAHKLTSALGRVDYARVRVVDGKVEPLAIGGASILSSTTRADGFVLVPADLEGYAPGTEVTVWLYD